MHSLTLTIQNLKVKQYGTSVLNGVNLQVQPCQHLAITGASGSGKTTLLKSIAGILFYEGLIKLEGVADGRSGIQFVAHRNEFRNLANQSDFYYQQRYNSTECEDAHIVQEEIEKCIDSSNISGEEKYKAVAYWLHKLRLEHRQHTPVIQLSNGEHKRLQLIRSLIGKPAILLFDQPFTGLDADSREVVHQLINELSEEAMIILSSSHQDLPACITHLAHLDKGNLTHFCEREEYRWEDRYDPLYTFSGNLPFTQGNVAEFRTAVYMRNVSVTYGEKTIFSEVDWDVKKGEKWLLRGANGSGKSTLLSLINGDNPQAYSNEIYLFDKRRGSGESIWDIKKKIGFVSPELHWYFDKTISVYEAVASGFFDTMGLYRKLSEEQELTLVRWIAAFKMNKYAFTLLSNLSAGQQRLVMLIRALVKDPALLLLDEPCQGLDDNQTADFVRLVDEQCQEKTIIYISHYDHEVPSCINKKLELIDGRAIISTIEQNKTEVA